MRERAITVFYLAAAACATPGTPPGSDDAGNSGTPATGGGSGRGTMTGGISGSNGGSGAVASGVAGVGGNPGSSGVAGVFGMLGGSGGAIATGGSSGTTSGTAGAGGTGGASGTAGGGGAAGATSGTGGSIAGRAGSGGAPADTFSLVFRDDFDTLDLARWQLMTHSWEGNLALFSASAAAVANGMLRLTLTPAPQGTADSGGAPKSFFGAEVRSRETLDFGRVRTRARFADGSAVVSALVTIYTPWPADDWNELDIECLGADASSVQFNAMVYTGPRTTPPVTTSVTPTQFPQKVDLGFDPSADFHVYTVEWTPSGARFLVDDVLRHTWTTRADLLGRPQNTLLTIWASSAPDWAGPVTSATGQAVAVYDWVELYRFQAGP